MQIASITTNEQGEYEYATEEDYLEQTLDIIIQKEGFERKNISYEIDKAEIKSDILLNELEKGTKEKTRIFGTIRNSKNRDPVKDASITLSIEGTQIAAITSDELGGYEYTAEEDYTGQTLDYVIQKEGFIRQDISHEIDRFEIESDFLMDKIEIEIKGKICDKADRPLADASISFRIGDKTIKLISDKDGSFSFTAGQQFLNQSIGYEASKEGFKVKSGKLELIEDLKCINLDPIVPFWNKNKVAVVLIALIGLAIVAIVYIGISTDKPELAMDPDSLDFNFRPDTKPQTILIWNEGEENLEWEVNADRDWITLTPARGTETGTVIVSVNSADLRPGSYTGNITVTSNGGTETGIISLYIEGPIIHYFMADPGYIDDAGGKSTLLWEVSGAPSVTIDGKVVDPAGEIVVEPDKTTIYILRATNEVGKDVKTVTVTVEGIPPVLPRIDSFVAKPAGIYAGDKSTLQWEVSGAASVTIDGKVVDPFAGNIVVDPEKTTTYDLIATNEAGKDVKTVTVTVEGIPTVLPKIDSFVAEPAGISAGEESTLQWEVSGAASVTIDGIGEVDPAGETIVHPDETTIYILRATNEAGIDVKTVTVTVEEIPPVLPRIISFVAEPAIITAGEKSILYWDVYGAANVTINGKVVDPFAGKKAVYPDVNTKYKLIATNEAGEVEETVKVIPYTIGEVVKSIKAPEGTWPSGLAWDGSNLWMSSNALTNSNVEEIGIYKLSPISGTALYICSPAEYNNYAGLTYDGEFLLNVDVYSYTGWRIYKLSTQDCSIDSSIKITDDDYNTYIPNELAWDGSHVWLYDRKYEKIHKVSPSGDVVESYDPPKDPRYKNIGLTHDDRNLWLSGSNYESIYKIDPSDFSVISSFPAPCSYPDCLAWDGEYLWCGCGEQGQIHKIYIGVR